MMNKDELIKVIVIAMIAGAVFMGVRHFRNSNENVQIQTVGTGKIRNSNDHENAQELKPMVQAQAQQKAHNKAQELKPMVQPQAQQKAQELKQKAHNKAQ